MSDQQPPSSGPDPQQPGNQQPQQPGYPQPGQGQPYGTYPPQQPGYPQQGYPQPGYGIPWAPPKHPQATTVLVLGIVGIVMCQVISPFAWYMGGKALKEIDADPTRYSGRSEVNAGKILGIVGTVLLGLVVAFFIIYFLFIIVILGVAAGTSSSSSYDVIGLLR
ncbi:MAG: DUF4190 domain-containing protein [Aeromicrobium erythreum]